MNTGFFYFFNKVLIAGEDNKVYISHLYDSLTSIEPGPDQKWLRVCFKKAKRGKRHFFLFTRSKLNGEFISCSFLKTVTNYGLDIKFSDGNLNIFCKDRKSLEFLKSRAERFLKDGSSCTASCKAGGLAKNGKTRVVVKRNGVSNKS
ncbi:hypothetical protein [Borrelia sp. P9F1]|uniref:hypothetical protein n=1 Tax=Borrelia sp. P9F1 TaxID=3058374 RepID=UPI0026476339|nr:hypothetical protein [Borrelia sp. P9F1]WKC58600.1 hypothetical protein QYZ68_05215 [Borrelia sp. P9F1]